jgi:hypothetical protein
LATLMTGPKVRQDDAIFSGGAKRLIGPITNTGQIVGNVEINNPTTVTGMAGKSIVLRFQFGGT